MNINQDSLPEKRYGRFQNLLGKKLGRHTVIEYAGKTINGTSKWSCKCDCGNTTVVDTAALNRGSSQSCGCFANDFQKNRLTTHGCKGTTEYNIWVGMKMRCLSPGGKSYADYGGRGITICKEWIDSFEKFNSDMGNRPSKKHSIERIDNDKGYSKENCKWETAKEQCKNRRSSRFITHNGKTQTLVEWARESGIKACTIAQRIKLGWTLENALTEKPNKARRIISLIKQH